MVFLFEHWFCRGVQAAIAQYAGCVPCRIYVSECRRRREGARVRKEREKQREEIINTQPERVPHMQPAPFEINEGWAEEIVAGPGPPKGWKKDKITEKIKQKYRSRNGELRAANQGPSVLPPLTPQTSTAAQPDPQHSTRLGHSVSGNQVQSEINARATDSQSPQANATNSVAENSDSSEEPAHRRSSDSSEYNLESPQPRPSMDRRLSSAVVNLKETFRTTIHPERWNWMRYDREDEILTEFNTRMSRMWDKMTGKEIVGKEEVDGKKRQSRKRADTYDSEEVQEWKRGKHPALNDLHPPVVSQLPARPEQAHWMLLPPPSADVMAGRVRPAADAAMRWPLAVCGRDIMLEQRLPPADVETREHSPPSEHVRSRGSDGTRTPELSTSSGETESEEWGSERTQVGEGQQRRSASLPLPGWSPVTKHSQRDLSSNHDIKAHVDQIRPRQAIVTA